MRKIEVLDKNTIDKIAAGEVVERPSSVVKELVENAIDAGATAVTVEITDGGKKLIRITDNGAGIEAEQVPTAFLRHATSKIEKVEDLAHIASLGFRGEALSSIAAVAQVELITRTTTALSGVRYVIEGGEEQSLEELGAPEGTTFLVRNLFYNTPARSKFLHSDTTEGNYVSALMEQLSMSHPEVSFKYIQNKQVRLHTSGNNNGKDLIYQLYGRDIARALLSVDYTNDFMQIQGFIGKPEISRGNRAFENYYINGRYVKNRIISKAIEDAYKGFLMQHKFPFVSLRIEMEGNDLDVNVHPAKMEVRFARGTEVYDAVYESVRNALTRREMIPEVPVGKSEKAPVLPPPKRREIPEPFETQRRAGSVNETARYGASGLTKEESSMFSGTLRQREKEAAAASIQEPKPQGVRAQGNADLLEQQVQETQPEAAVPQIELQQKMHSQGRKQPGQLQEAQPPKQLNLFEEALLDKKSRVRHHLIGQLFDTYWLVQFGDMFYMIDQHAAHEKIYYERFVKQRKEQSVTSQYLSPPLIVTLNLKEEQLLAANQKHFQDFGFEIESFGGKEYCISAVPADLYGMTETELFLELLDHLEEEGARNTTELFTARLATMACKAAVKGNHRLSEREANELIDELLQLEEPYHCPHGRPTIISMSKEEIEKKFHRIV